MLNGQSAMEHQGSVAMQRVRDISYYTPVYRETNASKRQDAVNMSTEIPLSAESTVRRSTVLISAAFCCQPPTTPRADWGPNHYPI